MECCTCHNTFKNKSALNYHRKTALYCLKLRGETIEENICHGCSKTFSRKYELLQHIKTCSACKKSEVSDQRIDELQKEVERLQVNIETIVKDKDAIISKLEEQLEKLQHKYDSFVERCVDKSGDRIERLATKAIERPTTQNVMNLLPLTDDHMKFCSQNLTIDHIKEGASGYARYALEHPFKDRVSCTDYSRKKIRYTNSDGESIIDPHMTNLVPKFFKSIEDRNETLIQECIDEVEQKKRDLEKMKDDELDGDELQRFEDEHDSIFAFQMLMLDTLNDAKKASKGKDTQMAADFVRHITRNMLTSRRRN